MDWSSFVIGFLAGAATFAAGFLLLIGIFSHNSDQHKGEF